MQGKSAWRMSRSQEPRPSKQATQATKSVNITFSSSVGVWRCFVWKIFVSMFDLFWFWNFKCRNFELNMPLRKLRAFGSFCKSFVWLSHPGVFRNRHSARKLRPPGMDRKGESHEFIMIDHRHNIIIYFFMLDCWLDESRGFCSWDEVPIPKLKTIHQWIKRWQWSPKGMGSIAWLLAVAEQSSTRHHSTFYPHSTCLYIRYDILYLFGFSLPL